MKSVKKILLGFVILGCLLFILIILYNSNNNNNNSEVYVLSGNLTTLEQQKKTVRIVANGDLLYHDLLYMSAKKMDGSGYDFDINFKYTKNLISSADLAIADYEGTINPDKKLSSYPVFNAPKDVVMAIKNAGYDAITLAQNHILDTGVSGVISTYNAFLGQGLLPFGVYVEKPRLESDIVVKDINGIKIALLAYSYGFNGNENYISKQDYNDYLANLDRDWIKDEIYRAKSIADIVLVMPHMGIEYDLDPSSEQIKLFDNMLNWGADIVLGGHPHVVQPTKTVDINGKKKFIIYSMGNFISDQRLETLGNKWTERGVIVDLEITKDYDGVFLSKVKLHPTWVLKKPMNRYNSSGNMLYTYTTLICEDVIKNRLEYLMIDDADFERIKSAYYEVNDVLNLDNFWKK